MLTWEQIANAWHWFFWTPESPVTLCVFRILWGLVLLISGLIMLKDARMWFGVNGVFPLDRFSKMYPRGTRINLLQYLPPKDSSVYFLLTIYLLAALCITIGFCPGIFSAIEFVLLTTLHNRNIYMCSSNDTVFRMMTFLLIFSNSGELFSVDQLIGLAPSHSASMKDWVSPPWCTRMLQLQLSILYLRAFYWKATGRTWLNGVAVYYALTLRKFRWIYFPEAFRQIPVYRLLTWSSLWIEFALGPLIWIRDLRLPIALAGMAMHFGISIFVNVELFSLTMIVCLVLFIPPEDMLRFFHFLSFYGKV